MSKRITFRAEDNVLDDIEAIELHYEREGIKLNTSQIIKTAINQVAEKIKSL